MKGLLIELSISNCKPACRESVSMRVMAICRQFSSQILFWGRIQEYDDDLGQQRRFEHVVVRDSRQYGEAGLGHA